MYDCLCIYLLIIYLGIVCIFSVTSNFEEPVDYGKLDAEADEFHQMVVDDGKSTLYYGGLLI